MKKVVFIILLLASIAGCNSDDENGSKITDSIIFGEIYGQCAGDCRSLYLLTEEGIYKDSDNDIDFGDLIEISDWENTTFDNQPLPIHKFELAQQLLGFPNSLLENDDSITEQVVADFDYFLQIKTSETSKTLVFDKIKETTNSEIKAYVQHMVNIHDLLRDN